MRPSFTDESLKEVTIVTAVKEIDEGFWLTCKSLKKESKSITKDRLYFFKWLIVASKEDGEILERDKLLQTIDIKNEIIKETCQLGIYNAFALGIEKVNPNAFIWFLNSGDEAANNSLATISKSMDIANYRCIQAMIFQARISAKRTQVVKPRYFNRKGITFLSQLPCHQSVIIRKANYTYNAFEKMGDEQLIIKALIEECSTIFINTTICIFKYGGASTVPLFNQTIRRERLIQWLKTGRITKAISEFAKMQVEAVYITNKQVKTNKLSELYAIMNSIKIFIEFTLTMLRIRKGLIIKNDLLYSMIDSNSFSKRT